MTSEEAAAAIQELHSLSQGTINGVSKHRLLKRDPRNIPFVGGDNEEYEDLRWRDPRARVGTRVMFEACSFIIILGAGKRVAAHTT